MNLIKFSINKKCIWVSISSINKIQLFLIVSKIGHNNQNNFLVHSDYCFKKLNDIFHIFTQFWYTGWIQSAFMPIIFLGFTFCQLISINQ